MGAHLGLLSSTTDTGVTDNANSVAGGEATDSDGEAGTEIDKGFEQGVFGLHAVGDEDGDDEAVDGNDTGHDNRNHGLHHQLRVHDGHVGDPDARLGGTVASAEGCARGNTQRAAALETATAPGSSEMNSRARAMFASAGGVGWGWDAVALPLPWCTKRSQEMEREGYESKFRARAPAVPAERPNPLDPHSIERGRQPVAAGSLWEVVLRRCGAVGRAGVLALPQECWGMGYSNCQQPAHPCDGVSPVAKRRGTIHRGLVCPSSSSPTHP